MNAKTIGSFYNEILDIPNGAKKVKVDLHVHTPASYDFIFSPMKKEDAYLNILDEAIKNNIQILAITDRNTFSGFRYIKTALRENAELRKKYTSLTILCGIEITCFSKHLIAIFSDEFEEERQNVFLHDIGIEQVTEGSEDALADRFGPALLIEKIGEFGGIAILAHADSAKGFLQDLCGTKSSNGEISFNGKSLAKIIQSQSLLGVQCNNNANTKKIIGILQNKDYLRKTNPLAILKCSDCHGVYIDDRYYGKSGQRIGSIYSELKLSENSFNSLKMALRDAEMRVCNELEEFQYPFIEGVAICSSIFGKEAQYSYFHFGKELNCIIGSRGTGKTTLLEIIQSIIMPNSLKNNSLNQALSKYYSAIVFLRNKDIVYAVHSKTKKAYDGYTKENNYSSDITLYSKKSKNKNFKVQKNPEEIEFLRLFLSMGYQQRQLYDYSKNPDRILEIVDDFLNWKFHTEYKSICSQLKNRTEALQELLKNIKINRDMVGKSFIDYIESQRHISEIKNLIMVINKNSLELRKLRINMINELNNVLSGKVKLSIVPRSNNLEKQSLSSLAKKIQSAQAKPGEYFLEVKRILEKIYFLSAHKDDFSFYAELLDKKYSDIINEYKMRKDDENILLEIRKYLDERDIVTFIMDNLKMEYNINSGTIYSENFKDNRNISMGQNAVALLLLILNASYVMGDNRPLLMDQPEDDLDNSYIYSTLVKEFRNSKTKRQVIISTHNPNIPVAADAENIMVLEFNGEHGYLANTGSIDSQITASKVLDIMEGGKEAIQRRISKYNK